ncbi:MAG: VWA domain-containing protein [Promethearchaeota archaeon]
MSERRPENIVICIDTSRSMFRTDYKPNRLICSINATKKLINERLSLDNSSAFSIVSFSDNAEKLTEFSNLEAELYESLENLNLGGKSALGDALALSIKLVIEELRKIMAKTPRILVVSDGNYSQSAIDPVKMAHLAQGLSIKIDSFRIGEMSQLNILKRLSDLTGGNYYYSNSPESLLDSARRLADDNFKVPSLKSEKLIEKPEFLRKIAANLLRVQDLTKSQETRIKQLRGEADYQKCTICFSENNPYTKGSFYLTGRYCPNCQTPYHVHCLASWAASQTDQILSESGTCRCPHCFYLLKIPSEVTQIQKLKILTGNSSQKQIGIGKSEIVPADLINISNLGEEALYKSCPVCHLIFEEDQKVVRCPICNEIYHEPCFKELDNSMCKNCFSKLHLY